MPWGHPRYIGRFENEATGAFTAFPVKMMVTNDDQDFRRADQPAIGANYAYPFLRGGALPREVAPVTVRGILTGTPSQIDTAMDALSAIYAAGMGKLWSMNASNVEDRWCWAIMTAKPKSAFGATVRGYLEVTLQFARFSDWFGATLESTTNLVNTNPETWTVTNPGNLPVRQGADLTVLITALGASAWADPITVANLTNGKSVIMAFAGTTSAYRIRYVQDQIVAERSANSGGSYTDSYNLVTTPAGQIGFLELEPGANSIRVTGATNANVTISYWAPYLLG